MNTATHMTSSNFAGVVSASQLHVLPPLDRTITSNAQFISTIVPRLEKVLPDYLYDGVLPCPLAIYYGNNDGEYLYGLLDTLSNGDVRSSALADSSLVMMAIYFGNENGEHNFHLLDGLSAVEGVGSVVESVPLDNEAVGPY